MDANEWVAKVEEDIKELAEGTDKARASDFFREYLDVASRFWKYSVHNQFLIMMQCPKASKVAGFRRWKELGRYVKKGEHGIRILAPSIKKVVRMDDDSEDVIVRGFFLVSVFDVSQTEGKALPELDLEVSGDDKFGVFEKLLDFCKMRHIVVRTQALDDGLYGLSSGGLIVLSSSLSINGQVTTLIHEIAHEILHRSEEGKKLSRDQKEIQAEGTAYVVSKALGLQAKSFEYLALYDVDYKKIFENLKIISECAKEILSNIPHLAGFS